MGVPIYLVSACTSGEEFVAAFRRYADKNGLFVPIGEPLALGRRARFAVTLRDGGVMIDGQAEVISSARTASVLHGRVGMTLRFLEPDEASQTTLSELERARLAMKPAPPSIPPRPAEIPAEPRPVPPPIQGRIDAVNALAQCVAIGDPEPPPPPAPVVPRARTRSVPPIGATGSRPIAPLTPPETGATATRPHPPLVPLTPPETGATATRPHPPLVPLTPPETGATATRPLVPLTPTELGVGIPPRTASPTPPPYAP